MTYMNRRLMLFASLSISLAGLTAQAQRFAVKTNVLEDALLNPSLAAEVTLSPRWSFQVGGQVNFWTLSHDRKWRHWLVKPELRYWFCQPQDGHFVGAHLLGGEYNIGHVKAPFSWYGAKYDLRYQGWMAGAGLAYGYSWALSRHWNVEAEIGVGYIYSRHDVFECVECGRKIESDKPYNYVGPTEAALSLVYVF